MENICLDKTISLTKAIMKRTQEVPKSITIHRGVDPKYSSFNFVNSKTAMPIEHLGLAVLSYNNAVEQYKVTRVDNSNGEKTETKEFENLENTGSYISNFLDTMSPDALNWYENKGNVLDFTFYKNRVSHQDLYHFDQCKAINEKGEDIREQVVREAYTEAVKEYVCESVNNSQDGEMLENMDNLNDFVTKDTINFEVRMQELKSQADKLIPNQEQNDFVQDEGLAQ